MTSIFLAGVHHAFAQTDGTYLFPNSLEGDLLKTAKREIENLHVELEAASKFNSLIMGKDSHYTKSALETRYFEIISGHIDSVIGVSTDIKDVLKEEPDATFAEITEAQFDKFMESEWTKSIGKPVKVTKKTIIEVE